MSAEEKLESGVTKSSYGATDDDNASTFNKTGNSSLLTAAIIIANTCAIPSLTVPAIFANFGGWLTAIIFSFVIVAMNTHASIIVWRIYMCFPGHAHYSSLINDAFQKAPNWQRVCASNFTAITTYAYIFSIIAWNVVIYGQALGTIFNNVHVCLPIWMLIGVLITLPFEVGLRSMGSQPFVMWVNLALVFALVSIIVAYLSEVGSVAVRPPQSHVSIVGPMSFSSFMTGTSTMTFMLSTQYVAVDIISEMKDRSEFLKAASLQAAPFQILIILLIGLVGYCFIGSDCTGSITDYLPFGLYLQLAQACMLLCTFTGSVINGLPLCKELHECCDRAWAHTGSYRDWLVWSSIVSGLLASAWLVANLVPWFVNLAGLLGTLLAPPSCFIVPIITYVRIHHDFGEDRVPRISYLEWAAIAVWFIIALTLLFYGTYNEMKPIIQKWDTFAPPFSCNCDNMWDTCACSGERPGMEKQCLGNSSSW